MKWVTSNYKAGDLFIFDFGKGIAHCGIMTNVIAPGTYSTIEGNTSNLSDDNGGAVMRRTRYLKNIVGACRPDYPNKLSIVRILAIARAQIGIKESPPNSNKVKYNTKYYGREVSGAAYPWCAVFLWWLFQEANLSQLLPITTASCTALATAFGYGKTNATSTVIHLQVGSTGAQVTALQTKLNSLGYSCGTVDGDFGPQTQSAVISFQKAKGLEADGIVGPLTWTTLNSTTSTTSNTTTGATSMRILKLGSTGAEVVALQNKLNSLGYPCGTADGDFGPKTKTAVIAFQRAKGLEADGIVGPLTWNALNSAGAPMVTLKKGSKGADVKTLQTKLNSLGFNCGIADGDFGTKTYNAVIAFQRAKGLEADGIVGPLTWNALNGTAVPFANIARNFSAGAHIEIKPAQIERIEYVHGVEPTENILKAYNRIGCDIIINANFFEMSSGRTIGYVTDEGKILSAAGLSPYGFGFVNKKTPVFSYNNEVHAIDFLGGYPCLVKDSQIFIDTTEYGFSATSTARRGRTAIGVKADGTFVIRSIADNDIANTLSISQLAKQMLNYGCVNAINLDGGGSSSWITPWNRYVTIRPLDGFLCVWLNN
jgi:peptidoglycan hydrolase-like protein with peptidoglycan-binding domain